MRRETPAPSARFARAVVLALALGAAQATAQPADYALGRAPEQAALAERGVYLDRWGNVKPLKGHGACGNLDTEAHRGSQLEVENSLAAVVGALHDGHQGVEIDVQRLRDGSWVLHHDARIGRTVYGGTKSHTKVASIKRGDWYRMEMLDTHGAPAGQRPPFLVEVLEAFVGHAEQGQYLNIEIKGGSRCEHWVKLSSLVRRYLDSGRYSYSSQKLDPLECLRLYEPNTRLAYITPPNKASLKAAYGERYSRFRNWIRKEKDIDIDPLAQYNYRRSNNDRYLATSHLKKVKQAIGEPAAVHVDIRDLVGRPALAKRIRGDRKSVV